MNLNTINQIFTIFSSLSKEPKTELEYVNNFTLAVAVILSAQATDISVNKATSRLFNAYKTPEDFLKLGEDNLKKYIKTIGLYNSKAKNIIAFSKVLVEKYDSNVPNSFEELIKLPGIGQKTANVILNCAFGEQTIAVDTHVARVSHRIGLTQETKPKKIEKDLLKQIPTMWLTHAHHWLILHGRYVCKARKPQCFKCAICHLCEYKSKNL
ncbi:MAG: endonuclease III [Rickettsiaceae bacterium]|nr:endonuclease III [Rickettsiaceae bacterium]